MSQSFVHNPHSINMDGVKNINDGPGEYSRGLDNDESGNRHNDRNLQSHFLQSSKCGLVFAVQIIIALCFGM